MNACYMCHHHDCRAHHHHCKKNCAIRCSGKYFEGKGCNCRLRFVAGGEFWRVNDARIWHIQWFKFWVKRNANRTAQLWPGSSWALTDEWCSSQLKWNQFTVKLVHGLVHGRHGGGQGGHWSTWWPTWWLTRWSIWWSTRWPTWRWTRWLIWWPTDMVANMECAKDEVKQARRAAN